MAAAKVQSARRSGPRTLLIILLAIIAALIALTAIIWWLARPATPDAFYTHADVEDALPGKLLRIEPFAKNLPAGARGWRFLYATTSSGQRRAIASAILIVPATLPQAPLPVIAWAHGTTGIAPGCAPSVMQDPFAHVPSLDQLLNAGYAYVASDYAGLGTAGGHAYLVGEDAARQVLDAVKAARQVPGLLLDRRVVVWGHSQGGNSALWAGIVAKDYLPDIQVLGVAALAPASDLVALVRGVQNTMFGKIVSSYLLHAYAQTYPDVRPNDYLAPYAPFLTRDIASRCAGEWGTLVSAAQTLLLPGGGIFSRDPSEGPLGQRLSQNSPWGPMGMPLFVAQGDADDLVLPEVQTRFVMALCKARETVDYRAYAGLDHLSLVAKGSPLESDLMQWTKQRLEGEPSVSACAAKQ